MTGLPSVSVVIPVSNRAAMLGDVLSALANQAGPPETTEVIVDDNRSTDGTGDVARSRGVTVVEEPKPGPSAARNRGLQAANGEVVAHLDSDTVPTRRWLAEIVAPFVDPDVVLVAGRTLSYRPRTPTERYIAASGLLDVERAISRRPFPFAPSMNMAVRRSAAVGIGGWAEEMATAEDVDFSFRLLGRYRTDIVYRPSAVLFHRNRASEAELRKQAWTYGEGAAHMYRRYPEVVRWDVTKKLVVAGRLTARTALPALLAAGRALDLVSSQRLEFARCHRLWTWWFWRGFVSMYRRAERRTW